MKRFQFKLQKYLNLKQQQEAVQRLILFNTQVLYDAEVAKMCLIERRLEELLSNGKSARQCQINIEMILLMDAYQTTLAEEKLQQAQLIEKAWQHLQVERSKFMLMQKDRKLLQRLRENKWQAYYQGYLSEEQKGLDEVGTIGYCRQGSAAT